MARRFRLAEAGTCTAPPLSWVQPGGTPSDAEKVEGQREREKSIINMNKMLRSSSEPVLSQLV